MSSVQPLVQNTVQDTWRWLLPDLLLRIVPMGLVPFLYILLLHLPLSFLGLTTIHLLPQLAIGAIAGVVMTMFAMMYRIVILGSRFRRPTPRDQVVQSVFYVFINGPVEELFFRGFVLAAVTQWTGWIGWGWLVSTAAYTLYHRLGKWSWKSVGGVGLAGLVFSAIYLLQAEPRSLAAVVIVHGLTTSGFLSWGDEVLYQRWKRKQSIGRTS